jgi:hypothetical protein
MFLYHPAAAYQGMCGYDLALGATEGLRDSKEGTLKGIISTLTLFNTNKTIRFLFKNVLYHSRKRGLAVGIRSPHIVHYFQGLTQPGQSPRLGSEKSLVRIQQS